MTVADGQTLAGAKESLAHRPATSASTTEVAIIGAGPYGLSLAAHLAGRGVAFRIFGTPMTFWSEHMPKGMHLKSEGFASDLYDPQSLLTLRDYCKAQNTAYADQGWPVPLELFCAYGLAFQRRFVPQLEQCEVTLLQHQDEGFVLSLSNGSKVTARRVVVAAGIADFAYVPECLQPFLGKQASHSADHVDLSGFRGQHVAVVGAGASAADTAALLHEAGAKVELLARSSHIDFHLQPSGRRKTWLEQLRNPDSGLGPGWRSYLSTRFPLFFHAMPLALRLRAVARHLGPAPGWFVRDKIVGKLPVHVGTQLVNAKAQGARLMLDLRRNDAALSELTVDHVIAATGYRTDLRRMPMLDKALLSQIQQIAHTPVLDRHFQASVPGLYFVGAVAANSFGPMLRFAYGARFAAQRVSTHLSGTK